MKELVEMRSRNSPVGLRVATTLPKRTSGALEVETAWSRKPPRNLGLSGALSLKPPTGLK